MSLVEATKRYVGDDRFRVRLLDVVAQETQRVLQVLADQEVSAGARWSEDEFRRRIGAYDGAFADLVQAVALIGYWGGRCSSETLLHGIKRTCDRMESGGTTGWLNLQWYPPLLLFYAAGIAAIAAGKFDTLLTLMHAPVRVSDGRHEKLVLATTSGFADGAQSFKLLPGLDRKHVPFSEHVYELLRRLLEDVLHLGSDLDLAFDTFEVFRAMQYAHLSERGWAPIGRFGWRIRYDEGPWKVLMKDVEGAGESWPPLAAGLCGGSRQRFKEVAEQLVAVIARHPWF